jgi:hypothetical protein
MVNPKTLKKLSEHQIYQSGQKISKQNMFSILKKKRSQKKRSNKKKGATKKKEPGLT